MNYVLVLINYKPDYLIHTINTILSVDKDAKIYLFSDNQVFQKSAAVFKVAKSFSWNWRWIYLFSFLPSRVTDFFYDLIAKNRYLWFGRQEKCKIPTPELAERFLD